MICPNCNGYLPSTPAIILKDDTGVYECNMCKRIWVSIGKDHLGRYLLVEAKPTNY